MNSAILIITMATVVVGLYLAVRQINGQLLVIHDLVNSNLTRVTADLKIAEKRIAQLEEHISEE